jgi:hypothetical protein
MRKRKIIRGAFYTNNVNLTTFDALRSIDAATWQIHYSYVDGSLAYIIPTGVTNATTSPVVEGSVTTAITVTPANFAGYTGATQQLSVVNEDNLNVISECNFLSYDTGIATVSAGGLITVVSASGSTTIRTSHADAVSGYTGVSGYTYLSSSYVCSPTGATILTGATTTIVIKNNSDLTIPNAEFTYVSANTGRATVAPTGIITGVSVGTTTITATHKYNGLTAVFTVIVTV